MEEVNEVQVALQYSKGKFKYDSILTEYLRRGEELQELSLVQYFRDYHGKTRPVRNKHSLIPCFLGVVPKFNANVKESVLWYKLAFTPFNSIDEFNNSADIISIEGHKFAEYVDNYYNTKNYVRGEDSTVQAVLLLNGNIFLYRR
jgi:hypothetical protein